MYDHVIWTHSSADPYWEAQSKFADTVINTQADGTGFGWNVVQLVFTRAVSGGATEDVAVIDLSFAKITTAPDHATYLTGADMALVETDLLTWWTSAKAFVTTQHTLSAFRWYQYTELAPRPGPAVRTTLVSVPGTGAGTALPLQTAATVTFRTASRRHWGRIYMPGATTSQMSASGLGHFTTTYVDGLCGAFHTLFASTVAHATLQPVVASRQYSGILSISQVNMDDTPDQQRRRRPDRPTYNKLFTS